MRKSEEILIELLKAGLGFTGGGDGLPDAHLLEITEGLASQLWEEIYAVSKRHGVAGIAYDAVVKVPSGRVPAVVAARWLLDAKRIEAANKKSEAVVDAQREIWSKNGVAAILQKGLSVAVLYPIPEHRSCGDIDWYFPGESNWRKAEELIRNTGATVETDSDGDFHYTCSGVPVEHHRKGLDTSDPSDMLVMLNEHFMKHAMVMGIGLRHICDLAVAYRVYGVREGSETGKKYYSKMAEKGLLQWTEYLEKVIDFQDNELMELVLEDGNFGLDKQNRFSGFRKRAGIFLKYAPSEFASRWISLVAGRIKRKF